MKRKNALPLLLALAFIFASAPVAAHAAQQKAASPPQAAQPAPPHLDDQDQRDAQRTISGPYRLTYTVTELDGNRRVASQRYAIVLDSGEEVPSAELKLGSKIPLQVGELQTSPPQTQFSYVDVGLVIDASLRSFANGYELRSHIVQSTIDISPSPSLPPLPPPSQPLPPFPQQPLPKDPVIRETNLKSSVLLQENKPVTIGNMDMLGNTHVLQIQVELSKLP